MNATTTSPPIRAGFRRNPMLGGGVLAGALLALTALEVALRVPGDAPVGPSDLGIALAGTVSLIWRRRWPPAALAVAVATFVVNDVVSISVASFVAVYSATAYVRWPA